MDGFTEQAMAAGAPMLPVEDAVAKELQVLGEKNRYRSLPVFKGKVGRHIDSCGRLMLNLSSNDYLGLGDRSDLLSVYFGGFHPDDGAGRYALTSSSSRLLCGNHPLYRELEFAIASMYGRQAALVFNSGYHANTGILPALATRHDLVLSDRLNHASIIDGILISGAQFRRYRHADYDHLEEMLEESRGKYRQVFIITESVFSMDGDLADLRRLVGLKRKYHALLIVDEAHGVGVFGRHGLGLCEQQGVTGDIDILIGTFGKALASTGAYALMSALFREYLVNTMRTLIFTTALPPVVLGWSLKMIREQEGMHAAREHLLGLAARLRESLKAAGFDVPGGSHIVPVLFGTDKRALDMACTLREAGFHALPVRPPTVPENSARIRFSLRADLQWEEIESLAHIMKPHAP